MQVLHSRCAGLDVHQKTVVACVRLVAGSQLTQQTRTFSTTIFGLGKLAAWLHEHGVTHVVMESTSVYWKPVWYVLDDGELELVLANARDVRNLPGRKTDVSDAAWLADLLAHGLVRASFVAPQPIQELRDLTRTRKQLVREAAQHTQRIQKILESANIKLTGVLASVMGKSGRAIITALVAGETNPETLAGLAVGRARTKRAALAEALHGRMRDHHRELLRVHLDLIAAVERAITEVDASLGKALAPLQAAMTRLTTIPGVSDLTAQVLLAEIGDDMSRFPSPGHLRSWAGLCPRNHESAGKRHTTRLRDGAPWLKATLVQSAWSAASAKGTYLRAQFLRLKARRGPKKAVVAVAASMLTAAYFILRDGVEYHDLGADHFVRRDEAKVVTRLARRIKELGYQVEVTKKAA
jgi:transposase